MLDHFPSAFSGAENPPHSHPSRRGDSGITTLVLGLSFVRSAHVEEPLLYKGKALWPTSEYSLGFAKANSKWIPFTEHSAESEAQTAFSKRSETQP